MSQLVIGLGTGRCGTRSFTKFLKENGRFALHDHYHLPWEPDYQRASDALADLFSRSEGAPTSSVAFYWLNYVEWLAAKIEDVRFVCLKREKEKVVRSFMSSLKRLSPYFRMWNAIDLKMSGIKSFSLDSQYDKSVMDTVNESTREWMAAEWYLESRIDQVTESFPDYEGITDKKIYLEKYWDEYYAKAERLAELPNFMLVDLEYGLNTDTGRREILNFIGDS